MSLISHMSQTYWIDEIQLDQSLQFKMSKEKVNQILVSHPLISLFLSYKSNQIC